MCVRVPIYDGRMEYKKRLNFSVGLKLSEVKKAPPDIQLYQLANQPMKIRCKRNDTKHDGGSSDAVESFSRIVLYMKDPVLYTRSNSVTIQRNYFIINIVEKGLPVRLPWYEFEWKSFVSVSLIGNRYNRKSPNNKYMTLYATISIILQTFRF